jgi:DNA polymerase III epsilon subunit-like protein
MATFFDIETTGLNPHENQVVLIGMKTKGKIGLWKLWEIKDEAKMISDALREIERLDETIVGYNNLKFDVPFMLERLRILGKYEPRYWNIHSKKWFDLYQYLGNDYRSLRTWLQRANIRGKHPELHGKDIPKCFTGKDFEKIVNHNIDDLNTSEKLFKFLKKMNPELIPFE